MVVAWMYAVANVLRHVLAHSTAHGARSSDVASTMNQSPSAIRPAWLHVMIITTTNRGDHITIHASTKTHNVVIVHITALQRRQRPLRVRRRRNVAHVFSKTPCNTHPKQAARRRSQQLAMTTAQSEKRPRFQSA
jgi:electron transfer flavoprotein alpha subunit